MTAGRYPSNNKTPQQPIGPITTFIKGFLSLFTTIFKGIFHVLGGIIKLAIGTLYAVLTLLIVCFFFLVTPLLPSLHDIPWPFFLGEDMTKSPMHLTIKGSNILQLELGLTPLPEYNSDPLILGKKRLGLLEHLQAIHRATLDPHIHGILIKFQGTNISLAQAAELRAALEKFKKKGKKVFTFGHSFAEVGNGTAAYYLASVSHKIFMQPTGSLSVTGFRTESPFFREFLERYGISFHTETRENYKGVTEALTNTSFSPYTRENLQTLLNDLFSKVKEDLKQDKRFTPQSLERLLSSPLHLDEEALKAGYIDKLLYEADVKGALRKEMRNTPELSLLSVNFYNRNYGLRTQTSPSLPQKHHSIGVIVLDNQIPPVGLDPEGADPSTPEGIQKAFATAMDRGYKAIILRINSPGGSVTGSEAMWYSVKKTVQKGIPVIVSMGAVAASGGYYIAAPATKIFALPTTITGSIGVAMAKPNIRKLSTSFGITWDAIEAGSHGDMWSFVNDYNPVVLERIKASADHIYKIFMGRVSEGRKLSPAEVREIAQGKVWSGQHAKNHNLVDHLGGFYDALQEAARLASLPSEDPQWEVLNRNPFSLSALLDITMAKVIEQVQLKTYRLGLKEQLGALSPLEAP